LAPRFSFRKDESGTHHFELDEIIEAYDVFADAANTNAMKVVLSS
jgi:alcohol dehydrogenase